MGRLDRDSDTIKDLCAIRKPIVWFPNNPLALKDHSDEGHLARPRYNDSEVYCNLTMAFELRIRL